MKVCFVILCLGALGLGPMSKAAASPFRTRFVCVPPITANEVPLEFRIRDQGACADNEAYMEVHPQDDGSTLLLPANDNALNPEQQRELDHYRQFFGGSRGTPEEAR